VEPYSEIKIGTIGFDLIDRIKIDLKTVIFLKILLKINIVTLIFNLKLIAALSI
jgi:hypothetical protein